MYEVRIALSIALLAFCISSGNTQDIGLFNLEGSIQRTYINPGLPVSGKLNIAALNFQIGVHTDGPSINDITSVNASGNRFVDISKFPDAFDDVQNIYLGEKFHTLDLSYSTGSLVLMAGHSFNTGGSLSYTGDLMNLLARGNAPFIGQTLEIGPAFHLIAYNELYLGAQWNAGAWTFGIRPKLLFGTAGAGTSGNSIRFTTDDEFYQLRFENNYSIRSSALFRINTLDEIDISYPELSFENLFYNNVGLALDAGVSFRLNDRTELSAAINDIGKINWDFFPRLYTSKGSYSFEGVDLINYISDSTGIGIKDSLINLFSFDESLMPFSTVLPSVFYLGGTHRLNDQWTLSALYRVDDFNFADRSALSLSAISRFRLLNAGINYTIRKNNFASLGISASLRLGPVMLYTATENILALFNPFDHKLANINFGAGLKF